MLEPCIYEGGYGLQPPTMLKHPWLHIRSINYLPLLLFIYLSSPSIRNATTVNFSIPSIFFLPALSACLFTKYNEVSIYYLYFGEICRISISCFIIDIHLSSLSHKWANFHKKCGYWTHKSQEYVKHFDDLIKCQGKWRLFRSSMFYILSFFILLILLIFAERRMFTFNLVLASNAAVQTTRHEKRQR